jgi:hypothetical protein
MRPSFWLLFVLAGLAAAAAAAHAPDGGELERNRRLLEKWKADPEHYERLKRDLAAFHALPIEYQERLRELDRQLHETDPDTQARLWAVLERYVAWVDRLPEADRVRIVEAAPGETRLLLVRGVKRRQWVERLPRTIRQELARLSPQDRDRRLKELEQLERKQRVLWGLPLTSTRPGAGAEGHPVNPAVPNPMIPRPKTTAEFPPEVQGFIRERLVPRLSDNEKKELARAEGKWPDLPRLVARLAEEHPVLPPGPLGAITRWDQLPGTIRNRLEAEKRKGGAGKIRWALQKRPWPEFALSIAELLKNDRRRPAPLGASKPSEFPLEVQVFLRDKLFPALDMVEKADLKRLEGRWPEYPRRLLYLARAKQQPIPGMSLPGPAEMWTGAYLSQLDLPDESPFVGGPRRAVDRFRRVLSLAQVSAGGR